MYINCNLPFIKLKESGGKCNIEKSFFGEIETEYLGLWATHNGIGPLIKNRRNK